MKRFHAVMFDAGGVLVTSPVMAIGKFLESRCSRHRDYYPTDTLTKTLAKSYADPTGSWAGLERGDLSLTEFLPRFQRELEGTGQHHAIHIQHMQYIYNLSLSPRSSLPRINSVPPATRSLWSPTTGTARFAAARWLISEKSSTWL